MTDKTKQQDTLEDAGRRKLMAQGAAVAGGLAVFAAGYSETVGRAVTGLVHGTAGTPTADAVRSPPRSAPEQNPRPSPVISNARAPSRGK